MPGIGNARSGQGDYLVAEADESDGSLVKHHPSMGIVTNIELDHPDSLSRYSGSNRYLPNLRQTMRYLNWLYRRYNCSR